MGDILGMIGSVLSGGVTGLVGVVIQRIADYKMMQLRIEENAQKHRNELELRTEDRLTLKLEYEGKDKVAATEAAGLEAVADASALEASFKMEPSMYSAGQRLNPKQRWVFILLDAIRGIIRPGLTVYLCALTTYIWMQVSAKLGIVDLPPAAVLEVWKLVVATILYLTTTCVLWWFGTRNKQKQPGA